jgi:cation transport ATPase
MSAENHEEERFYTPPVCVPCYCGPCKLRLEEQLQDQEERKKQRDWYFQEKELYRKRNEKEQRQEQERLERERLERERLKKEKELQEYLVRKKEREQRERREREEKEKRDNENLLNFMKYEFSNKVFSFKLLRLTQLQNFFSRLKAIPTELTYTLTSLSEVIKGLEKSDSNVLQHCNSLIALRLVCDYFEPSEVCVDPRFFKQSYFVDENLVESIRYLIFTSNFLVINLYIEKDLKNIKLVKS